MLDLTKKIQTKSGHSARILSADFVGKTGPGLVVAYKTNEGEVASVYPMNGTHYFDDRLDLVNVEEFITLERYCVVRTVDGAIAIRGMFASQENAEKELSRIEKNRTNNGLKSEDLQVVKMTGTFKR